MSVSGSRSITLNTALMPSISWSTKNVIVESISPETEIVTPWWQIHSILPFALGTSESVLGDGIGTSPCVWSSTGALRVSILQIVHLTDRAQFSMVCSLINHGNDISRLNMIIAMTSKCSKLKWNREWFHWKVLNILTSLLWSIRVETMESCWPFVFCCCNNLDGFELVVFRKDASAEKYKLQYKLPHHHVIFTVCTLIDHSSPTSFPGFSHLRKPWERGW